VGVLQKNSNKKKIKKKKKKKKPDFDTEKINY
jgi:hypothetical protein